MFPMLTTRRTVGCLFVFLGVHVSLTWVGFDERAIDIHQRGSGVDHADVWSAGERVKG